MLAAATGDPEACYELFQFVVVHSGPRECLTTARTKPRQAGHRDKAVYKYPQISVPGLALHFLADTADGIGMPVAVAEEAMALLHLAALALWNSPCGAAVAAAAAATAREMASGHGAPLPLEPALSD